MNKTAAKVMLLFLAALLACFYLLPSLMYFAFKLAQFMIVAGVLYVIYLLVKRS